jgi:hypothetical protein
MTPDSNSDALLAACDAMLREAGGTALTPERLAEAGPVIEGIVKAIRSMDELDLGEIEPAIIFRLEE